MSLPGKLPTTMSGVVLTGHGGPDKLEWRDELPVPTPERGEVLVRVRAASVNNTDINTRTAWYSKSVRTDTAAAAADTLATEIADGAWSGKAIAFPLVQGADCCGEIVAVGAEVPASRCGDRVLVRALQSWENASEPTSPVTLGSEYDGAFAQFVKVRSRDALTVRSGWSDLELASIPCAYSTAEAMLQKINLQAERVLVTGASGGVGSAAVQLAKRRGARVTAVTSADKAEAVRALGADEVIDRDASFGKGVFDAIVDVVAGPRFPELLDALRRGGRYAVAGAIAGPIVELDVRTLYLRDLTLHGSTFQPDNVFIDLVGYVERNEIEPAIAAEFPLRDLARAQEIFLSKKYVGKIVLRIP